jgi:hypothetical protein|tara:strand:- start:480 stop:1181 length:702 start_codon:yes stop_codon:yes gene_type:complete
MRNFILIIIAGISISASAQINFNNDTIDLVINESAEILNEAKAIIKNQSSNNINYDYFIFRDDFKGTNGWFIQFCDCNGCLEVYPAAGSCKDLVPTDSWFFVLDARTETAIENKFMSIAFSDPNNSSFADTLTFKSVKGSSLGRLNSDQTQVEFSLIPNPATDAVIVSIDASKNSKYDLSIVNLLGETIVQHELNDSNDPFEYEINVTPFEPGLYFVVLQNGSNYQVHKLIVE